MGILLVGLRREILLLVVLRMDIHFLGVLLEVLPLVAHLLGARLRSAVRLEVRLCLVWGRLELSFHLWLAVPNLRRWSYRATC